MAPSSTGRSVDAPLAVSVKSFSQPAAFSASGLEVQGLIVGGDPSVADIMSLSSQSPSKSAIYDIAFETTYGTHRLFGKAC